MKKVKIEELEKKSKEEVIDDLRNCRYSLLDSIGCKKLRLEMLIPGLASAIIVRFLCWKAKRKDGKNWTRTVRNYIVKLFKKHAPYEINHGDKIPENNGGLIIGFNHPSLGEILRLIGLISKEYPDNKYLFPVNLPWYESLCPVIDKMKEAGFYLTPIVTPSTKQKIEKTAGKEMLDLAISIGAGFNNVYLKLCSKFAKAKDIILVAPSATRQATVFKTDEELCKKAKVEPATMSLLAQALSRDVKKSDELKFLPITVVPPRGYGRGLNLDGVYKFGISEPISFLEAIELSKSKYMPAGGRKLDFEFLKRIAVKMFRIGNHSMIAPLGTEASINGLAQLFDEKVAL